MKRSIAIIGMGCSGTLVLRALTARLHQDEAVEILMFEQSGEFGPGIPYGHQHGDDCFILNMQSSLLGANLSNEREFFEWLERKSINLTDEASLYVQRTLMGEYLKDVFKESLARLDGLNIRYRLIKDEVRELKKEADAYEIGVRDFSYRADHIVLAVGHQKKTTPFPGNERYIANPYHALEAIKNIPRDARIGILGTKLTAVDMALLLHKHGFENIAMFSKSGSLPLVRGSRQTEYHAPEPDKPELHRLSSFLRSFRRQLGAMNEQEYDGFVSGRNEHARLRKEIRQAAGIRKWHALLDRSKDFIDEFWLNLSAFKKHLFLRKYQGMWMSYRHPMPLKNAHKITQLLGDRLLSVYSGYVSMAFDSELQAFRVAVDGEPLTVDYVIDATGTPVELLKIDSPLIQNLLQQSFIAQCEFGGARIDPDTYRLQGQDNIFAIGQLTRGTIFYVSAIERLLVHAEVIASQLVASNTKSESKAKEEEKSFA